MIIRLYSRQLARPAARSNLIRAVGVRSTTPTWRYLSTSRPVLAGEPQRNVVLEEYLKREQPASDENLAPSADRLGKLTKGSIFETTEAAKAKPETKDAKPQVPEPSEAEKRALYHGVHPSKFKRALDPNPEKRVQWQRKMVIRSVRRRGWMSKADILKRTERESLTQSKSIKGSVKKLNPLARQIAGKKIEDAITQMRFSKKKAAKEVMRALEFARDEAIVRRGMGLGKVGEQSAAQEKLANNPIQIRLKDGTRHTISDATDIYVDQAWTGRKEQSQSPEYRARGRINILTHRFTSMSFLLKEEKTRIRLHKEREQKLKNRKVWQQLPDRPITAQRQYCVW